MWLDKIRVAVGGLRTREFLKERFCAVVFAYAILFFREGSFHWNFSRSFSIVHAPDCLTRCREFRLYIRVFALGCLLIDVLLSFRKPFNFLHMLDRGYFMQIHHVTNITETRTRVCYM